MNHTAGNNGTTATLEELGSAPASWALESRSATRSGRPWRLKGGLFKGLLALTQAAFLGTAMLVVPAGVSAANPAADLDQCANGPAPSSPTNGCNPEEWVNGNLGESKSIYREGDSVPYRLRFSNLDTTIEHTVIIEWDTTKGGKHAFDYLTTFDRTVADADPCVGVAGCDPNDFTTFPIPLDPQVTGAGVTQIPGVFTMYGGTITDVSVYSYPDGTGFAGDKSAQIAITFTADVANPVLAWGGHIATRQDWGANNSAVAISGSPYHMRLIDLDGAGGNQDRSLSAAAVIFPASITIIKDVPGTDPQNFAFTASGGLVPASFNLDDDGDPTLSNTQVFPGITNFTTYTIAESLPAGWQLTNRQCSVTSPNGGSTSNSGDFGVSINLKEGENVTCTFTNGEIPSPAMTINKTVTSVGSDVTPPFQVTAAGQVISYSILVTNTGNVTLTGVVVSDPRITGSLDCDSVTAGQQTSGLTIPVGGSITCTGSYTVLQSDLDDNGGGDGDIDNTATADSAQTDPINDSEAVPLGQSPALVVDKVDDGQTYDSVGDVIDYTITVTNTGNVTLTDVEVTDTLAIGLDCDPLTEGAQTTGFTILVGEHITCTARHIVTQADLDDGSYLNTACADDGEGGAIEDCDSVTTPGDKNPELTTLKVDDGQTYDSVGDVIDYTITVTNTGNVTLTDVEVTDTLAIGLDCDPLTEGAQTTGFTILVGEHITCTARHIVTQADLDDGSYLNTACADDGEGGAEEHCDSVETPSENNPILAITKVAAETSYTAVGQVIHYTIVATNIGNVTLTNVVITDAQVTDLDCEPDLPVASLAVGATITCTASHTIVQADLDAGFFFNEACVDDGNGDGATGADPICDDVTVFGQQAGGETDIPTQPPTDGSLGGGGNAGPAGSAWLLVIALGIILAVTVLLTPNRKRKEVVQESLDR